MAFDHLLSVRLRDMWRGVPQNGLTYDECKARQRRELERCGETWARALLLPGETDLVHSTLLEVARWRHLDDLAVARRRCEDAVRSLKQRWERTVKVVDAVQVQQYYDSADDCVEELIWWHTLCEDNSPLAYVAALEFAASANCTTYLDYGSGVGSGAILFRRHGYAVTLADISGVLLAHCRFRFDARALEASFVDLKQSSLPVARFDFITAMDVFEHLVDPAAAINSLDRALKPGGYVYGRFASELDRDRPQHIVHDFQPVFDRFAELGYTEVFRDEWLWGHQAFEKHA